MNDRLSLISSERFRKITSSSAGRFGAYIMGKRYVSGEYNLFEYGRIIDTESLAARAIKRKVTVTFRNGFEVLSSNKKFLDRIKQRLKEIEFVTETSFDALLDQIVRTLYLHNNCYILKTRSKKSSTAPGKNGRQPIAGLSVLPVETVDVQLDPNGNILGYKQRVGGWRAYYNRDDVIHIAIDKRPGMIIGTPPLEYVKDDIIALRKIEENVELLIDRSIFPLLHAKVGTPDRPATILSDGTSEVDSIAYSLATIDKTGGLVTNERVQISAIGAESLALRVESYLTYFKTRVLIGLGVSAIDLGEGDSSGRTTGEVLSLNMVDTVEYYQKAIEIVFRDLFREMLVDDNLIKSTYLIKEEDEVTLDFKPASKEKEIKDGAHYADLYGKGVATVNEARNKAGLGDIRKEQENQMFHERTNKEPNSSGLSGNVARPKNQHSDKPKRVINKFDIPKGMMKEETKTYALAKISSLIDSMDLGIDDEGIIIVSNRVIDRVFQDLRLSYLDTTSEEVLKYILE